MSLSLVFLLSWVSGMPRSRGWTAGTYPRRHTLLGFLVCCMPPCSGKRLNGCTDRVRRFPTRALSLCMAYARMRAPFGMLACTQDHKHDAKDLCLYTCLYRIASAAASRCPAGSCRVLSPHDSLTEASLKAQRACARHWPTEGRRSGLRSSLVESQRRCCNGNLCRVAGESPLTWCLASHWALLKP